MSKKVVITDVNVELKVPSVSKALSSKIIGCFIEYISYIRNQIPFNFQIFNLLIQKKLYKLNEDNDDNDWHKFKVQRQLELANETINSINKIKENISLLSKDCKIEECVIVFGSTISTAKESYKLILPAVSNDSKENCNETDIVNQILLSISQNMTQQANKKPLKPCNMFVALRTKNGRQENSFSSFDILETPASCSQIHIHLKNPASFSIFQDFQELTIIDEDKYVSWMLSDDFVKGFDDILIKRKSIWD